MESDHTPRAAGPAGPILQVIGNGDAGGGTTAVLTLAQLLHEAGERVAIASQKGSYLLDAASGQGLVTRGFEFTPRAAAAAAFTSLAAAIADLRPAIVHAHGGRAGLPVALAHRLLRRCDAFGMVYTVHGFHFPFKPAGVRQLARLSELFCMSEADHTVFVSASDRRIADECRLVRHPGNTAVINNAVSLADLPASAGQDIDIVFIGRLTYQKNVMILPDVVAALRPLRPSVHVVGGGELAGLLREKVRKLQLEEQFAYHGVLPREQALRVAARARTLVLPSRWEGHPIVVVEAMHLGVPVVASRVPGNDGVVQDGATGFLVGLHDVAGYAQALRTLLVEPSLHHRLSNNARRIASEAYSPARMLAQTQQVYRSVRARRAGLAPAFAGGPGP